MLLRLHKEVEIYMRDEIRYTLGHGSYNEKESEMAPLEEKDQ